jgi:hypothetical protein
MPIGSNDYDIHDPIVDVHTYWSTMNVSCV